LEVVEKQRVLGFLWSVLQQLRFCLLLYGDRRVGGGHVVAERKLVECLHFVLNE